MTPRRFAQFGLLATASALAFAAGEWIWPQAVRARHAQDRQAFAERLFELVPGDERYALRAGLDVVDEVADPAGGPPTVARYRTNDERLRRHEHWPPPRDGSVRRVLFVGDSYTFGSLVPEDATFPHRVQVELRRQGLPIFAINGGVPGYNSQQTLAWLRQLLLRHEPHHVVLGFVMNDAEPLIGVLPPLEEVYGDASSWLLEDGKRLLNALVVAAVDDQPACTPRRPVYEADYRRSWGPGSPKAAACLAAVVAMHEACRARGVGFTVAILPDFNREFDDTYPYGGIHEQVEALGRARGFATVDALRGLRGEASASLRVPGDGHPSIAGQQRLADQIAAKLLEQLRG